MSDNSYPAFLPPHYKTVYDIDIDLRKQLAYFHDDPNRFPLLMHAHNFYELNIIVRGHGRHYIEKKNYPANPGDVFAIPPKIQHGYWADGDMSIFHILIESSMLEKYNNTINRFPGFYTLFETEPHFRKNANNVTMFLRLGEK